jgi:2Fe-2S ferredoxin
MPHITFITFDGTSHTVAAPSGGSVMQAAVDNGIPGIDADCGGACACATCHVYVEDAWRDRVGPPDAVESSMLQLAERVANNSRLACQITLDDRLDGLTVRLPESQY